MRYRFSATWELNACGKIQVRSSKTVAATLHTYRQKGETGETWAGGKPSTPELRTGQYTVQVCDKYWFVKGTG